MRIRYGIDLDTGLVMSQALYIRDPLCVAWPVLDFAGMTPSNGWKEEYNLERFCSDTLIRANVKWTRLIPVEVKNYHREFWGMKPLKK